MSKWNLERFTGGRRVVELQEGATKGATVGVDLFYNGVLVLWEDIYNGGTTPPTPGTTITAWSLILDIPANVTALANTATTGLYAITGAGTSATREIQPTVGRTSVSNGDGVTGDPVIDLAVVVDSGVGAALMKRTVDTWGRVSGSEAATTDDLAEGSNNLYFTDERAQDAIGTILADTADIDLTYGDSTPSISGVLTAAIHASLELADSSVQPGDNVSDLVNDAGYVTDAILATTITDGDTTHAPDGNSVFDALATKPPKTSIVGKKIAFIGDSITGYGWDTSVIQQTDIDAATFSFFGMRMAAVDGAAPNTYADAMCMYKLADYIAANDFTALIAAAANWFTATGIDLRPVAAAFAAYDWASCDQVVIWFGTNDWATDRPSGTYSDTTGATFYGAVNHTVTTLQAALPESEITFITPLTRISPSDVIPNGVGEKLSIFSDVLLDAGSNFRLAIMDMYRASGINSLNWATFLSDGIHPDTAEGRQRVADKIAGWLLSGETNSSAEFHTTQAAQFLEAVFAQIDFLSANGVGAVSGGAVSLRPSGIFSATGALEATLAGFTWNGNTGWHAGNLPVVDGSWTPTITNGANVDASTPAVCYYERVGNTVHYWGRVDVDPTANATTTTIGISLPVASNFGASQQSVGTIRLAVAPFNSGPILADATNDRLTASFTSSGTTSAAYVFHGSYRII